MPVTWQRVRVLRPHSHWPWLLAAVTLSLVWSFIYYLLMFTPLSPVPWVIGKLVSVFPPSAVPRNMVGLAIWLLFYEGYFHLLALAVMGGVILWLFVRRCGHLRWVMAFGAVYGGALPLVTVALGFPATLWNTSVYALLAGWVACMAGGAVTVLIAAGASRLLGGRQIIQDGTRCPACAYDVSRSPTNRCSECGKWFSRQELLRRPDRWRALRTSLLIVLSTTGLLGIIYVVLPHVLVPVFMAKGGAGPIGTPWSAQDPIGYLMGWRPRACNRLISAYLEDGTLNERRIAAYVPSYRMEYRLGRLDNRLELDDPSVWLPNLGQVVSERLFRAAKSDPDVIVRRRAARTLLVYGEPSVVIAGSAALRDCDDNEMRASFERDGIGRLISILYDPDIEIRAAAHRVLLDSGVPLDYDPAWDEVDRLIAIRKAQEWFTVRNPESEP